MSNDQILAVFEAEREEAYHRMVARSWLEKFAASQTPLEPEFYDALYTNREEMYLRDPVTPCQSPELTRLETYRPYGT